MPRAKTEGDIRTRIRRQLWRVWEGIAFDLLEARRETAKLDPSIDPNLIPGEEVAEVVMDQVYGQEWSDDPEASKAYAAMSFEEREAIARETFPDNEYGI